MLRIPRFEAAVTRRNPPKFRRRYTIPTEQLPSLPKLAMGIWEGEDDDTSTPSIPASGGRRRRVLSLLRKRAGANLSIASGENHRRPGGGKCLRHRRASDRPILVG